MFNDTATTEIYTLSLHDALPTPIAYIKVVAVKKLVVGFLLRKSGPHFVRDLVLPRHPRGEHAALDCVVWYSRLLL